MSQKEFQRVEAIENAAGGRLRVAAQAAGKGMIAHRRLLYDIAPQYDLLESAKG